ncbi:hypothetical protein JTZ62_04355 [Mammaliicoccus sciuri]|uniref:hypothetical protein n=1 Tax=Mammaliicoccus sciuri TaxID=1296 RepID=UPI0019D32C9C|nr:hypothetical protein [Mammaliicoccus sciuri]QSN68394.1 hypothetical protein JTZ62_04355 [Mammaliicoccus sciuri]UIU23132.1 hypothetical protein LLZ87_04365 [Mammaliicoccus sciuri]UIU26037.1 hypothetical protein LLZ92_04365 [Mammaliicoccus sciuri]
MALNKHFNVDTHKFEDRPKPKLWLLKPNGQRIERIAGVSKLQGTFKYTNLNQITFQISPTMFDSIKHEQVKNTVFDKIRNKYIIEFKYNNFRDYFVIDDLKEVSNESENIQVVADSLGTELNGKSMNEIEMLGSTIREMYNKIFENYAPLWSIEYIDSKVENVKRELTAQQGTVMSTSEQINTLFDTVTIFDNINRKVSVYHKDSVGINRGLRVRENSYLKSFEDSMVSKDIITRLIPMGSNGLTIHSANPAGSDYIEDFSFFIKPFKRDANRNVIEHSDYMSDELCHALLDYEEFYETKKEQIDEFTKRYSDILKEHAEEDFKLKSLDGIVERQEDRIELLKPKSEYIELGIKTSNFNITVDKSSYYILMLKNEGTLTNIRFDGKLHQLKSGEWTYIKIDTADFQDATKVDQKLQYKIEMVSATTRVQAVITRSSLDDYEEDDTKKIEEKYNYLKYKELRDNQKALVASIERRMKQFEDEKADLVASMNPKLFLSEELYKEREQFVYSAIWQEENHTDAKELFDDAEEQLKKKNNVTRSLNVGIVNFIQSLEHKEDWDKLNVGDKIVFSNKFFNKKLKAYITEMQIGFDENSVNLTLSDVFDYKDEMQRVSELIASTSSTSNQVNMHKQQIKESQGKLTKMTELIEGEWDANKQRVLAGNETVDIGSHGVKVISNENPNEFVIMVGGVIAMTKDGGETFKTGVTPDGVNAEMLIGKMIIGEDLWLENESGTMRFNKDGFHIDSSLFHLTTNDGKEDYFDKLKNELQEEAKQQETRIKESYQREIQNAIQESVDVENIINTATSIIEDTFADGIITDVEKKLINDTLSSLEKENSEYVQQIELALNHPYISDENIIKLEEAYVEYDGMYETLVQSINESISDNIITSDESTKVNEAIVNFRDEVKEILVLVQEILETTRDNQLNHKIEQSLDYTSRLTNDLKDEMNDLNRAFESTKETIDEAIKDGIFDAAEIESIKTALMIMKSEQQDILNRYEQVVSNQKLPADARTRIVKSHDEYVKAFKDFNDYVLEMISDGIANDTERTNYQTKFDTLTQKNSAFTKDYTYALQAIALQYTQDAEGKLQEQYDGLKMEIEADIKDVRDNMLELENIFDDAFKDGIVTESEITRLNVHLDMLDREFLDVEERYKTLVNDNRIEQTIRTSLSSKRSTYSTKHSNLRTVINRIIEDRKVTSDEKTEVNNAMQEYNSSFSAFTKVIQEAMNNLSQNLANNAAENKKQEMISELNKYKETVNNDFTELHSKVDNFEDTIWDSFEDQIIETTEASAINQYINILANEKARIEKQYAVIINNKDLTGSPKTQLSTSYGSLNTSYSSLIETIQSAIADNKIIETEKTAVNQKFADYKLKLSDYEDKINKAIDSIIKNVATSEANKVNERFETWKSSEFLVESEKISQRVSGSSWESTYLPTVEGKISGIQVGTKNLLLNSKERNDFYGGDKTKRIQYTLTEPLKVGQEYTFIFNREIISGESVDKFSIYPYTPASSLLHFNINESTNNKYTFTPTSASTELYIYPNQSGTTANNNTNVKIKNAMLVEGNKIGGYLPAPEDIDNKINNITVGANNILINSAFTKGTDNWRNVGDNTTPLSVVNSGSNPEFKKMVVLDRPALTTSAEKGIAQDGLNFEIGKDYILSAWVFLYNTTKTQEIFMQYGKSGFIREYRNLDIGKWTRVEMKFVADQNLANVYLGFRTDKVAAKMAITGVQLVKGNYNTEWSPSPVEYETTIEANSSFIEQNKNQILSSVSKSEVDATLSKIATYETSYQIKNKAQKTLLEYNGIEFNDNYSYEVVAKARYDGYDTLAVATFISKGKGKGFELTIIDQKGTTGVHPLFELVNNKPSISVYSNMVTEYTIDVIYTKYLGSASNIERTNSQIKQVSDNITLSVDRLHEELDYNNMLLNSDFTSGFEGWGYVGDNYSIASKQEMGINIDNNLLTNSAYRTDIVGSGSSGQYRRIVLKLIEPLIVGKIYTVAFNMSITRGDNKGKIDFYPYNPSGERVTIDASSINRNTYTFTATAASTELLFYTAISGTPDNSDTDIILSKVTCIEGDKPLDYKTGSNKNVLKMQYSNANNWPSIISNYMNVGRGQEVSIGDELTLSTYIYVPSSSKEAFDKGYIYFELAGYENTKQGANATIGQRLELYPKDVVFDKWVRYSYTVTVPETTANGKTNYVRFLLRMAAGSQGLATNSNMVFYYGLPQLEKGNSLTRWTPAKLDALSTEGLATKIALNPESIDIISQNLNINTDVLTIKNSNGNFTMSGDTLRVSDSTGKNVTEITPSGLTIKADNITRMINGLDRGANAIFPYQPRMPSYTKQTSSKASTWHVIDSSFEYLDNPYYTMMWGTYQMALSEGSLIGAYGNHGRINRYTYYHDKRYLKIDFTFKVDNVNCIVNVDINNTRVGYSRAEKGSGTTSTSLVVDLGTPTYTTKLFDLTMAVTQGTENKNSGSVRIKNMQLIDFE